MEKKIRILAHILVVAVIGLVGTGAYAVSLHGRLDDTSDSISAVEQDRNAWKLKAEKAEGSIQMCTAHMEELESRAAFLSGDRS